MTSQVEIVEVAARDGLQSIATVIPTDQKITLIEHLLAAGIKRLELGSFVSPKAVPQMADIKELLARFSAIDGVRFPVIVPNQKGAELALAAGVNDLVFVLSASEAHNQSNVRRSIEQSLEEFKRVLELAGDAHIRLSVSTCFDCPFDGDIDQEQVFAVIDVAAELDRPLEIAIADTTGRAFPFLVEQRVSACLQRYSGSRLTWAFHGHDTFGMGLANALYAYQAGIRVIDGAAAGLGGCPFAPGASGNTATEDLVFALENMGVNTGLKLAELMTAADFAAQLPDARATGRVRALPRQRVLAA